LILLSVVGAGVYLAIYGSPMNGIAIKKNLPQENNSNASLNVTVNKTQDNNTNEVNTFILENNDYYELISEKNISVNTTIIPLKSSVMKVIIIKTGGKVVSKNAMVVQEDNGTYVVKCSVFIDPKIYIVKDGATIFVKIKKYDELKVENINSYYNPDTKTLYLTFATNVPNYVNMDVKVSYVYPISTKVIVRKLNGDVVSEFMIGITKPNVDFKKIMVKYSIIIEGTNVGMKMLTIDKGSFVGSTPVVNTSVVNAVVIKLPNGSKVYMVPNVSSVIQNTTLTEEEFTNNYDINNVIIGRYIDVSSVLNYYIDGNVLYVKNPDTKVSVIVMNKTSKEITIENISVIRLLSMLISKDNKLYETNSSINDIKNGTLSIKKVSGPINTDSTYVIDDGKFYYVFSLPDTNDVFTIASAENNVNVDNGTVIPLGNTTVNFTILFFFKGLLYGYNFGKEISLIPKNYIYLSKVNVNGNNFNIVSGLTSDVNIYNYVSKNGGDYAMFNGVVSFMMAVSTFDTLPEFIKREVNDTIYANINVTADSGVLTLKIDTKYKVYVVIQGVNLTDVITNANVVYANDYGVVLSSFGRSSTMIVGNSLNTIKGILIVKNVGYIPILSKFIIPNGPIIFSITS